MRGLLSALAFLTRLPVPRGGGDFAAAARAFPLAGLAVGAVAAGAGMLGALADPWLGAAAALVTSVWVTGALHLDGLADLADGLGAAHGDRDRMLAVMADPRVGGFGAAALATVLPVKLVLLHLLLPHGWAAVLTVPAAARAGPLLWARRLAPLKTDGLGAAMASAVERRDVAGWALVLAGAGALVPPLLAAFVLLPAMGLWFRGRVGGMTGDAHGAGIEAAELALLAVAAAWYS